MQSRLDPRMTFAHLQMVARVLKTTKGVATRRLVLNTVGGSGGETVTATIVHGPDEKGGTVLYSCTLGS